MVDINISKIKIRKGTNDERLITRFDQGELVYTTDTKRLYVGNGLLSGGNSVASKIHPPISNVNSLSNVIAEVGDLVSINSIYYQLTASPYTNVSNWGDMRLKISSEIFYDVNNTLTITLSGLSASKINPNSVSNGLVIRDNQLQMNYNSSFFELSSNRFSIKQNAITTRELLSSSFGNGLSGGNGNLITLRVNPNTFYFDSGILNVDFNSISSYGNNSRFFTPLSSFNSLSGLSAKIGDVASVNGDFYQLTANPPIALANWGNIGPKNTLEKSIFGTLTGNSSLNSDNSLSAIFNGTPSHTLSGGIPGLTITKIEAISSNGVSTNVVTLSSAGFLTFEGDFNTKSGQPVGRFAIPIFAY
jgi:hypothetical protein